MYQNKLSAFRRQFRDCDALFLDDVDFFAKKQATQEEFLHTLDTLLNDNRPVALTSDCHPRLMDGLVMELMDRLMGGVAWSLLPPDRATRLAILQAKTLKQGRLSDRVLEYLADQLHGNVRELEGAINTLVHLARVTNRPIDLALAREALVDILRHSVRLLRVDDVEKAVCDTLSLAGDVLRSKQRTWTISHPRMLAMFLARKHTSATYSDIGRYFGGRNHSTVVASEKKVRQWLADNTALTLGKRALPIRDLLEKIERVLNR
jgi:chromosomal replication initiator protein